MAEDESLLDVFVRVLPHPDNDDVVKAAADKTKAMFASIGGTSVGPGASRATDELKQGFIDAKRYADDLSRQAGITARAVKSIGDEDVSAGFRTALDQLKKARQELRESSQDKDPLGLEKVNNTLDVVAAKLRSIRGGPLTDLSSVGQNRDRFRSLVESERQNRSEFNIDTGFSRQFDKGGSFAEKFRFAELTRDVKLAEAAFDSLQRTFRDTGTTAENQALQLQRLGEAAENLANARQQVSSTFVNRRPGSQSANTLSNNAYQLGQAIEDASVGFQLNGFAGAVRGSANNISFILNDLSRLPVVADVATAAIRRMRPAMPVKEAGELGAKIANMIPLAAGVGAALAILVLPRMIEWLQSLSEVDFKLKDIGERIKNASEDAKFSLGQSLGSEAFERTLKDAASIEAILDQIEQKDIAKNTNISEMQSQFESLRDSGAIKDVIDKMVELNKVATTDIAILQNRKAITLGPLADINAQLKAAEQRKDIIRDVVVDLNAAQSSVAAGSPDQIERVTKLNDTYRKLKQTVTDLAESTSGTGKFFGSPINAEDVGKLVEKFAALSPIIEQINKDSLELKEITETNILQGFDAILNKSNDLAFGIRLVQKELDGLAFDGASEIDALFIKNQNVRDDIAKTLQLAQSQVDPTVRQQGLDAASAATGTESGLFLNQLGALLKKAQEDQQKQNDKSKSSTFTDFDSFAKKLQLNALSPENQRLIDSQKALAERIQVLTEVMRLERANPGGVSLESFRSVLAPPTPQEQAQSQALAFEQALRVLMPPLFQLVDSQNKTTDAVQKARGAVLQ